MTRLLTGMVLILLIDTGFAAVEYRKFDDPAQEQTYHSLISELRCLVCQNQTIADSNADLAKDLRRQVYEMLQQGNSRQQIIDFMTQRYGDFVMYRPAFNSKTAFLWLGPMIFMVIGFIMLFVISHRRRKAHRLSAEKQARISQLLEKGEES